MASRNVQRLALVGRGIEALRVLRAAREIELETGEPICSIAVVPEGQEDGWFGRGAKEVVTVPGPPSFDIERLGQALEAARVDQVWATRSGGAMRAELAALCASRGWRFVGPSAEVLRQIQDPVLVRRAAEQIGIATVPWSGGPVDSAEQARLQARSLGYPVAFRAVAQGIGRLWVAAGEPELPAVFRKAQAEAAGSVLMERLLEGVRRLEVPVLCDQEGNRAALEPLDATIRRAGYAIYAESPVPGLSAERREDVRGKALELAQALGQQMVGTMVFLYDPRTEELTFLGYASCCAPEHAAAEARAGVDLVKSHYMLAGGGPLPELQQANRHAATVALEVHRETEGPVRVEHVDLALGPGVRVDAGSTPGDDLQPPERLASVTASGRGREDTIAKLQRVLRESVFLVQNATSTLGALARLLDSEEVFGGRLGEDRRPDSVPEGPDHSDENAPVALLEAAIEAYELEHAADRGQFHAWAKRGRPRLDGGTGRRVELTYRGHVYTLEVRAVGAERYDVEVDGHVFSARIENRRGPSHNLVVGTRRHPVSAMRDGHVHRVAIAGEQHRILTDRGGVVRAESPAVIVSVHVGPGDLVSAGDRLAVLEAMKTELTLCAPISGRVREVMARSNVQVGPGAPLVWIEPEEAALSANGARRVAFDSVTEDLGGGSEEAVELFETLLLGYDVPPDALRLAIERYTSSKTVRPELWPKEDALLARFMTLAGFTPQERAADAGFGGRLRLSHPEYLRSYLMDLASEGEGLPSGFLRRLREALEPYGVADLAQSPRLLEALYRLHLSLSRRSEVIGVVHAILGRRLLGAPNPEHATVAQRELLDRLVARTQVAFPSLCEAAREVRYAYFDGPFLTEVHDRLCTEAEEAVDKLTVRADAETMQTVVCCPQSLSGRFLHSTETQDPGRRRVILEALTRRYYRVRELEQPQIEEVAGHPIFVARYPIDRGYRTVLSWLGDWGQLPEAVALLGQRATSVEGSARGAIDLYVWRNPDQDDPKPDDLERLLAEADLPELVTRAVLAVGPRVKRSSGWGPAPCFTFRRRNGTWREERNFRSMHPMVAERLRMERLSAFELDRVEAPEDIYAFVVTGRENPEDRRIVVYAEVRDISAVRDEGGKLVALPQLERMVAECFTCVRRIRATQAPRARTEWNRVELFIWPQLDVSGGELRTMARKIAPASMGLGLEKVRVNAAFKEEEGLSRKVLELSNPEGQGVALAFRDPAAEPIPPLTRYEQKVIKLRRRGLVYPYEVIRHLTPEEASEGMPKGAFTEYDLTEAGGLEPVERPWGQNKSNIIVGVLDSFTDKYPEGMKRVALFGDPSRAMGSLAEPECRRINAALDLAEQLQVPVEWYAVSAGAEISTERGTENMDWIAAVLKRIIEYTQAGGELNVVVCGINVGAQPYWNAEATMLMHTKGVLIMLPEAAMVLTGKQALDYSGGVSADDNLGIGGYDRVMGPNGQAQFIAKDVVDAGRLLLRYYEHSYRAPGERYPRARTSSDPVQRDVCGSAHGDLDGLAFDTVGEVFSATHNPGRKRPFDIRRVMAATVDQDSEPLERWRDMRDAETVVVWDAHLGGQPVSMLGFQSRPIRRLGYIPADGPMHWTAGTLFPQSSKKAARAINAASGNRPLVILANLSGFDGSPESLRNWQLEYGAEIGRSVVNFDGPIVFCVVSRYHGGAFVVFSNKLNPRMKTFALEGTHASVIGGAPAAAVVFARELKKRVQNDERVKSLEAELRGASGTARAWLSVRLKQTVDLVRSEKLGGLADEFDGIHSVERARDVGSVHEIIPPNVLRPRLVEAVREGMADG